MRRSIFCCILGITLVSSVLGQTWQQQTCDRTSGHEAVIQPDAQAFIVGYFSMHYPSPGSKTGCGDITHSEMQGYEAIRWVLDRLNKKGEILNGESLSDHYIPGVRIGMKARDYCAAANSDLGLVDDLFPQLSASERDCQQNPNALMLGMIGMTNSDDTTKLAKYAEQLNLPLVAFQATAPVLSDTEMFTNFMRTIPPDGPLTYTIVEFIKYLKWKYVVVVFTDNTYGNGAYREIRPQLADADICLTTAISVDPSDTADTTIDDVLSKVMETETVGVIYLGNNAVIEAILKRGEEYDGAGELQWIVTDSISISSSFPDQTYPRGLVSVVPSNRKIIEFEDHWVRVNVTNPSPENPWYKQVYMERNKCRLPGMVSQYTDDCNLKSETQRRNEFVQDQFVEPAVHAVYTYARALKNAHTELCLGVPGMCTSLRNLKTMEFYEKYMRNLNFTYGKAERVESLASYSLDPYNAPAAVQYNGNDLISPSFQIYNFNDYPLGDYKFTNIGSYINGLLEVIINRMRFYDEPRTSVLPAAPISQCPSSPCSPCLGALVRDKYVYIPGDVVIQGLFSVHEAGDSPFSCGAFYGGPDQGIQYLQAFIFAVEYVNNVFSLSSGRLKGIKLGALGFDDCMNHVRSNQFITEVQRHGRRIHDHNGENVLDPRTIEAYIGGHGHESLAISMADMMNTIKKPMMGIDTYNSELNDMETYPYFIRSQYNMEYLARSLVNVVKRNGWQYIQSVHYGDSYGIVTNNVLRRVAAEEGICVVASYSIDDYSGTETVMKLKGRPDVQPVVAILVYDGIQKLLSGIRATNATEFQLITLGGSSKKYIEGYEDIVDGMISVTLWSPDLINYREHLRGIDINTYMTNPWMQEWFENFYDCSLNPTGTQTACPNENMFFDTNFEMNNRVVTAIYSVIAITIGLDETLDHYCGGEEGLCGNFMNARDKSQVLMEKILDLIYTDGGNPYQFMERMGNIPFVYYNYNYQLKSFTEIGSYKPAEDFLYLEGYTLTGGRFPSEVKSSCSGVCMECLYLFRYQKIMYVPGDLIIPGIFDVHERGDSPYSCSDIRTVNGFQYTEAFRFALNRINDGRASVKLNGVKLGGLGFDGCTDPIRASALVTGMYSGAIPRPETDLDRVDVNVDEMIGWLSYDSASTISVSTILQRFGIPSITAGATSPVLDDKSKFTTFFRTIPSDGMVAEAMAKLSHRLGFSYIITLNEPEDGSREAVKSFRKYAEMLGICIGASYEFETDGDVEQIMRYILQSTTKIVAVFSSANEHIDQLLLQKETIPEANDLVFLANQPWTASVSKRLESPTRTITFMPEGLIDLEEFRFFLERQIPSGNHPNPWLREFYESFYSCNLAGTYKYRESCVDPRVRPIEATQVRADIRVIPTINAVYALAEGIHQTLKLKCGDNYDSVCASFISDEDTHDVIMQQMDLLEFEDVTLLMYRFLEREADRKIIFKRFLDNKDENEEGSFANGELSITLPETLKEVYETVPKTCVGQCLQCEQDMMGQEQFMYVAGDIHIGALFDIHKMGGTPYTCGEINDIHGFQLMEAFNWALDYVNNKQGMFYRKLTGVKLGALIFDMCSSPVRAGNLVANYHARNFEIKTDEYTIDPSLIDAYIGPLTSESSIRVADVLSEIGIPQISYGASSLELRNSRKYKYFIRTVPADDKQARAIISFLKKYEIDNIQVISQFSTIGQYGRDEFMRLAKLNEICVSQEVIIGQDGSISDDEAQDAVFSLTTKPNATVVVVIMDDPYILLRMANSYDSIVSTFSFIATDKWGFGISGYANLQGLNNMISQHKLVTLDVETADFPELDAYLEEKTPDNYMSNPWFREYYEFMHDCSVSGPTPQYPNPCPETMMGYSRVESYIQDPYALYVINAVFATALGIHDALSYWCTERYYGVCQIVREHGERREIFLSFIRNISFTDQTKQPFYFTENGESDRGFHVYEPQNSGMSLHEMDAQAGYYWEDIGSYNDSHYLKMDATYRPNMNSVCQGSDQNYCTCQFPQYEPSRYMKQPSPQDLNLVFVSDIHRADPANNLGCGPLDTGSSMQNLFAFLYAIKMVNDNEDNRFTGSLKLGGVALDTCAQTNRIGQDVYSLLSGEPICGEEGGQQVVPPSSIVAYLARNSANSIAVSSMLSPLKLTTLSMSATSVELNDKIEHEYFLRTVPPDNVQALVVAQILERFGWDYVLVVFSDNSYGRSAVDTLLRTIDLASPKFCFSRTISMSMNSDLDEAKSVIDQLNQKIGARVVVTFVSDYQVRQLLQATSEKGLKNRFLWVGSDTWANNYLITEGYEDPALGAITIQIRSEYSSGFRNFVKSITFNNRMGIPDDWFDELYQTVHQCRILDSQIQKSYTRICTGEEVFTDDMIPQDPFVLHTIISVFQVAHGLNDIEACKQGGLTIASCLALQQDRKQLIYNSILNAQHDVLPDDLGTNSFNFKFTADGFGDIGYNIYNFRTNLATSQYEYVQIGSSAGDLRLDTRNYEGYSFTDRTLPLSRCPIGSTCQCVDANGNNYPFSRDTDGYIITEEGKYLDANTGQLVSIEDEPQTSDRFQDIWALVVVTLAAIGAFASLCLFVYLLVVYPVRGGTTVLGYMLSFGIILQYVLVFAFIVHATKEICALRRFCLGFVYSICYAALFVKLVDCWRTRTKEDIYMVKYNKIGNPWGLFFSACLIVVVQIMINAEWLILEEPDVTKVIYNNILWPRCVPDDFYDEGLILSNLFVMFVIFLCVIVGLAAFGNDKNHWDSRWLLGCVVLTIPAWLVWCLVAALGEYKMRDAAVAIGLLYNASVMLLCGPMRKLYLLNKYQATVQEEERKSQLALSSRDYNSMYSRQYDNVPRLHDGDSVQGSPMVGEDDVFMYEPKH